MEELLKEKDKRIVILESINKELCNINTELQKETECLHCGEDKAYYCERMLSRVSKHKRYAAIYVR
ncbi:MAG: hypothetical protein IJ272_08105 [Clostridia bacterium]|nr:hypothetical protein [Clostridia bacterium]